MKFEYIMVIIISSAYLFALLVSGIFAYNYHQKHKNFIQVRKSYLNEWENEKKKIDINKILKPLKVSFNLPVDEDIFFQDKETITYFTSSKKRNYKFFNKTNIDEQQDFMFDNNFVSLKESYKLRIPHNKNIKFKGILYITNKRIMFENNNQYEQLSIDQIIKSYISVIRIGDNYWRGYIIHSKEGIYEIISSNPTATVIINELKNKGE